MRDPVICPMLGWAGGGGRGGAAGGMDKLAGGIVNV